MRSVLRLLGALVAFVCLFSLPSSHGAILGIDLGSEFIKVASVQPGKSFHIVLDEQAKRKIPAVTTFDEGERQFGNSALMLAIKKPKESIFFALKLLGKKLDSSAVRELQSAGYLYDFVSIDERNSVGIRIPNEDKQGEFFTFSPEELLSMTLSHIKKLSETDANQAITDAVITVPPFFTDRERQALLDAAEIAGLNVLSLINENTAAAIQYGIDRKFNENDNHTIILYNMGASSTKVSLVQYSAYSIKEKGKKTSSKVIGQFEIKSTAYDEGLGAFAFEKKLMDFIVEEVNAKLAKMGDKTDVRTNARVMAKIRFAAEKAKQVLSANKETPITLQSLLNDIDFKFHITRDRFYELSNDLLSKVSKPLKVILDESGFTTKQIDSVIIVGGGVRIPGVQSEIKKFMKRDDLAQNLNGDECFVLGALFRAANMSTQYQVRPFGANDATSFPVGVRLTELKSDAAAINVNADVKGAAAVEGDDADESGKDGESSKASTGPFAKRVSLFKRHNRLMKRKMVAFTHDRDFSASLFYDSPSLLPTDVNPALGFYNITGISDLVKDPKNEELLKAQKPRVSLSFLIDYSGMSALTKAEATLEEMVKVPVVKPKKSAKSNDTVTVNATDANSTESTATSSEKTEEASTETSEKKETEAKSEEKKEEGSEESKKEQEEVTYETRKKTHSFNLKITRSDPPNSFINCDTECIKASRAKMSALQKRDEQRREIQAARNSLESFIYSCRSELYDAEYEAVSTEEQRQEVRDASEKAEQWLYEPKTDESPSLYKSKLSELKKLMDPIKLRVSEVNDRPTALNTSQTLFNFVKNQMEEYKEKRPWVKEEDREKLLKLVHDVEEWLAEKIKEQEGKQAHEEPAFVSYELTAKLKPIAKLSQELMNQKKPVEKPKKTEKKENAKENDSGEKKEEKTESKEGGEGKTEENPKSESTTNEQTVNDETKKENEEKKEHEHTDL